MSLAKRLNAEQAAHAAFMQMVDKFCYAACFITTELTTTIF
jgi:hypothetical protein